MAQASLRYFCLGIFHLKVLINPSYIIMLRNVVCLLREDFGIYLLEHHLVPALGSTESKDQDSAGYAIQNILRTLTGFNDLPNSGLDMIRMEYRFTILLFIYQEVNWTVNLCRRY